jgi:hypothetical protein
VCPAHVLVDSGSVMEAQGNVIRAHEAVSLVADARVHGRYRHLALIDCHLRTPFTQEITGSNPVGGIAEKPGKSRDSRLAISPSAMVYGVGYHSWVPNETVSEPGDRWRSRRPARRKACRFMDREVPVSACDGGHGPRLSLVNMGTVRRPEDCCLRPKGEASTSRFGAARLLLFREGRCLPR